MMPQPPQSFTNPYEAEIIQLDKEYKKRLGEGRLFEDLKELKIKIKALKSELSMLRSKSGDD